MPTQNLAETSHAVKPWPDDDPNENLLDGDQIVALQVLPETEDVYVATKEGHIYKGRYDRNCEWGWTMLPPIIRANTSYTDPYGEVHKLMPEEVE